MKIQGTDIREFVVVYGNDCSQSEKTAAFDVCKVY